MLKIRRPSGRLIFNMGIAIPGKTVFLIETAPRWMITWTPPNSTDTINITQQSKQNPIVCTFIEIIFGVHPANERRSYNVTSSLIGWAHTQNDPCIYMIHCVTDKYTSKAWYLPGLFLILFLMCCWASHLIPHGNRQSSIMFNRTGTWLNSTD